jgi:hypothetical protein
MGNRTRDLPACSALPQPTAPPRINAANTLKDTGYGRARNIQNINAKHAYGNRSISLDTGHSCFQANSLRWSDAFLFSYIDDHRWQQLVGNRDYYGAWFMACRQGSERRGVAGQTLHVWGLGSSVSSDYRGPRSLLREGLYLGGGENGRCTKGEHLPPHTEVKNEWSYTSTSPHVFVTWFVLYAGTSTATIHKWHWQLPMQDDRSTQAAVHSNLCIPTDLFRPYLAILRELSRGIKIKLQYFANHPLFHLRAQLEFPDDGQIRPKHAAVTTNG